MDDESKSVRRRLSGMMFLIYAVQGAWWPLLAVHLQDLGITGRGRGWIFASLAIAAIATPLGAGQIADRWLPTQRLLALIYALGAVLMTILALGPITSTVPLFALFLGYWLLTAPSYGLANSLGFRNLHRPTEEFGGVRVWGTIGWMVVGWAVTLVMQLHRGGGNFSGRGSHEAFAVAAVLSGAFAVYCFFVLPNTPPLNTGASSGLDFAAALRFFRRPSIGPLMAAAFGVSLTTPFVYQTVPTYLRAGGLASRWIASAMTLSQVLEIASLALLPVCLRRLGYRGTLVLGIAAWALYYLTFAVGPPLWLALMCLPLNGVAIGCFIVTGQMYMDSQAPRERRASVQAFHVMVTSGLGSFLGNLLAGELMTRNQGVGPMVFAVPFVINVAMVLVVLGWFRVAPRAAIEHREHAKALPEPVARERAHLVNPADRRSRLSGLPLA